jgi:uncharacterized membrane protein YfcA
MMFELSLVGISVGILSGFFGIGGGTILVPLLLMIGYSTKTAIGISIVQMVFSSLFGSYLNHKKGTLDISMVFVIGVGGFSGAMLSGYVASYVSSEVLETIFFCFVLFALGRMFFKTKEHKEQKKVAPAILFFIGIVIGFFSMLIGVGGSILLVPILVGFLHVPLKQATSAGLFFVIFSSVSGLISHSMNGHIEWFDGIVIGLASLAGVYGGIHLKHIASNQLSRKMLMVFYMFVLGYLSMRLF